MPGGLLNERETGRGRELHFLLPGETDDKVEESTNCLVFIFLGLVVWVVVVSVIIREWNGTAIYCC